jgi:hypothetical protein
MVATGQTTMNQSADPQSLGPGLGTRLYGRRLRLVRLAWLFTIVPICVLLLLAAPARYVDLSEIFANLSPAQQLALQNLGIPGAIQAGLVFAIEYMAIVSFVSIGVFIFWRRSDEWIAILISGALIGYIAWTSPPLDALLTRGVLLALPSEIVQSIGFVLAGAIFLYFPNGRLYPRWTVVLLPVIIIAAVVAIPLPSSLFDLTNPFRTQFLSFVLLILVRGTGVLGQIIRYFRVSTPIQRLQTKWILSSVSLALLSYLIFGIDRIAMPLLTGERMASVVYDLVWVPFFLLCVIPIPIAFAYAILRHRLWDIDALISRTIVYASLTAILAGLYTASITLTQRLFVAFTGERSSAAIALTTLVVAASFTPIRSFLQGIVDHYVKQRPDPSRTFRAFGHEVEGILAVVDSQALLARSLEEAAAAFGATGGALYLDMSKDAAPYRTAGEWQGLAAIQAVFEIDTGQQARIVLGPRPEGRGYTEADQELLQDTAVAIAGIVQSVEQAGFPAPRPELALASAAPVRTGLTPT